jgi:SAM-dependent methyltransferase
LDEIAPGKHFNCILDLGCNDLYLLKQLQGRANARVGIDPLWIGKEDQRDDKSITVLGAAIEDVDLDSTLKSAPDLIVCRHTLEHIYDPRLVLQKLLNAAAKDALFLFEVPGFDALVRRLRFDQVFHQHLQYFALASFQRLLEELGGVYLAHWENYHDWGALVVAFTTRSNGRAQRNGKVSPTFNLTTIRERYALFCRQLSATNDVLKSLEGTTIYGYGAAQMLPVLVYHLGNDLSVLTAVLDDDPAKNGLYYWNLPLVIRHTADISDLETASVFITAVDNVKPILSKLLVRRPRHIIYPFNTI